MGMERLTLFLLIGFLISATLNLLYFWKTRIILKLIKEQVEISKILFQMVEEQKERIDNVNKRIANLAGQVNKAIIKCGVASKTADRAFSLGSSSNVAIGILQRTLLSTPKIVTKQQILKDEVAKDKLADLFGKDEYEFLRPLLSDEENDALNDMQESYRRKIAKPHTNGEIKS